MHWKIATLPTILYLNSNLNLVDKSMVQEKVIVGGNVQGNVTSCENKEIVVGIDRKSVFSIKQTQSVLVYNQCTGNEISRYQYEGVTGFGIFSGIAIIFLFIISLVVFSSSY